MEFFKNTEINKENSYNKTFSETFIDKLNTDFDEGQKASDVSSKVVEALEDRPDTDISDVTTFVERIPDVSGVDFILGLFSNDFLDSIHNNYGFNLSDKEIAESVQKASDFFHLNSPKTIREDWTTGVILGMKDKGEDDILCFNREQMKELGITDREGFDLVMTHEGAHRALQSMVTKYDSHQEELCCDFMAGVRAGLNGMDEDKLGSSLEGTFESATHPDGLLRVEAIKSGAQFAKEYMAINDEAPSFSNCLERFDKKLDELSGNICDVGHDINLKEEFEGRDGLKSFVDDRNYHMHESQTAKEWAEWHLKRADEAIAKGDMASAKDHNSRAESYKQQAKDHLDSAAKCTK